MRISPLVLLLMFAMIGCGSGTQPSSPSVTPATAKTPDAAAVKKHMTPAQLVLGDPVVNSIGMVLVPIPAGEFQMGSPDSDSDVSFIDQHQRLVKIMRPFYLGVYEVTQQQYEKVMGVRPWNGQKLVHEGPDYPATNVSWNEAVEFCRKLTEQEGVDYRLPTEAQWEYACRAETTTIYSFGNDASKLGQYAWYRKNAWDTGERYAHRGGQKLPNPWGLHDMHGNVFEWCREVHESYGSENALVDSIGLAPGDRRVLRGGSFYLENEESRSDVCYYGGWPDGRSSDIGFRVSMSHP